MARFSPHTLRIVPTPLLLECFFAMKEGPNDPKARRVDFWFHVSAPKEKKMNSGDCPQTCLSRL